jgi:ribosomal protein S18 acetylase RimI-like enzyme
MINDLGTPDVVATPSTDEMATQSISCRPMTLDDIPSFMDWFVNPDQAVRDHIDFPFDTIDPSGWPQQLQEYYLEEGATSCVVEEGGRIIGIGRIIPGSRISYLPPHDKDESMYLGGIVVDKDARGREIGLKITRSLLADAFIDEQITSAYAWVIDDINCTDPSPALRMLEKAGFIISDFLPRWRDWKVLGFQPDHDPDTILLKVTRDQFKAALLANAA